MIEFQDDVRPVESPDKLSFQHMDPELQVATHAGNVQLDTRNYFSQREFSSEVRAARTASTVPAKQSVALSST